MGSIQAYFGFLEFPGFSRIWGKLGLTDHDLAVLQFSILQDPEAAPVVTGCGGARKIRFAAAGTTKGKSGAYRCIYKFLKNHGIIVLVAIYPKSMQVTLSESDKKRFTAAISAIDHELS